MSSLDREASRDLDRSGGREFVRVQVQDNGIGIASENLVRIFSHGFTTKKDGHGFGLHTCALAARDMHGSLFAESGGVGTGATFTLELPIAAAAAA
jgi:signal transduction histidine kinase